MPTFEELNRDLLEGPRDTSRSFARQQAMSQLLKLGDARARETLLALLRDPDRALRTQAIESLARFVDGKVLFAVTQALKDRDAEVRRVTAKFLGEVGDEASVHELEGAANDESWFVQYECRAAIEKIRARARTKSAAAAPPAAKAAAPAPVEAIPVAQLAPEPAAAPRATPRSERTGGPPCPPPVASAPPPTPMNGSPSDEDILRHVAARLCTPARKGKNGASFSVQIDEKRKQTIQVLFERNGKPPRDYVVFYTECGQAEPMRFEYALRNNLKMHFGALGITDRGGKPFFVLFDVVPRETVTPDVAAEIARKVARHGDAFEKTLSPDDRY